MVSYHPDFTRAQPDSSGLRIQVSREQHVTTVYLDGDVDLATAHLLSASADLALRESPLRLVLDLSEVSFFSAAGLSALLILRDQAGRAAVDLALRAPSPAVRIVLDIVNAAPHFRIAPTGFQGSHRGQSLEANAAA